MTIKNQMANLANKEMSRREFLRYSGMIVLSIVGITGLLRVVTSFNNDSTKNNGAKSNGYGSSYFGR